MEKQDCFFFIEGDEGAEKYVRISCVECMKDKKIESAMFWPGKMKGYGPFTYECVFCNKLIYKHEEK